MKYFVESIEYTRLERAEFNYTLMIMNVLLSFAIFHDDLNPLLPQNLFEIFKKLRKLER